MASQAKPIFLKGDPILVRNARLQSRGKKLWPGDVVTFLGNRWRVAGEKA